MRFLWGLEERSSFELTDELFPNEDEIQSIRLTFSGLKTFDIHFFEKKFFIALFILKGAQICEHATKNISIPLSHYTP